MANVERLQNEKKQQESVKEGKGEGAGDDSKVLRTQRSHLNENLLPIEDMKKRVLRNLEKLAAHDIVSEEDNYQAMVNIIARVSDLLIYSSCFFNCGGVRTLEESHLRLTIFKFVRLLLHPLVSN